VIEEAVGEVLIVAVSLVTLTLTVCVALV